MSIEAVKYNPANIKPENLFNPPTVRAQSELIYLAKQLGSAMEGKGHINKRILLIGTEFEMFFFSPDIDPREARHMPEELNPNYQPPHKAKIDELKLFFEKLHISKPSAFLGADKWRISFEARTAPQTLNDHLESLEVLGNELRRETQRLNILPVVYSQHIHMSLRPNPIRIFGSSPETSNSLEPDNSIVRKAFSEVEPLMLLPEEWGSRGTSPSGSKTKNGVKHPEFRLLSSEYANDPVLNLLVSLRAMYAGCIDNTFVTGSTNSYDYVNSVEIMRGNASLTTFFGESTLNALADIAKQYPDVSKRLITIDQVKQ